MESKSRTSAFGADRQIVRTSCSTENNEGSFKEKQQRIVLWLFADSSKRRFFFFLEHPRTFVEDRC
jgi:hypothetical protein